MKERTLIERVARQFADVADFSAIFSPSTKKAVERDIFQADLSVTSRDWLSFSTIASLFAGALSAMAFFYASGEIMASTAVFLACFAAALFVLKNTPGYMKKRRAARVEAELPIALRSIATEITFNSSFEKALSSAKRYGVLGNEVSKALKEIESGGASVSDALRNLGERVDSLLLKRACAQLVFTYEHGLRSGGLRKLANELIAVQKARSMEYSAKLGFMGLAFIAVACIVPALFAAYAMVGSSFMDLTFSAGQVWIVYVIVFPALDLAILLYLREKAPKTIIG
jgi:Flp pilus assembly protein TadB